MLAVKVLKDSMTNSTVDGTKGVVLQQDVIIIVCMLLYGIILSIIFHAIVETVGNLFVF